MKVPMQDAGAGLANPAASEPGRVGVRPAMRSASVDTLEPSAPNTPTHRIVQFAEYPELELRQELSARGAAVLSYVPDAAVVVTLDRPVDVRGLGIVWAGPLAAESKISPLLAEALEAPEFWLVEFFSDVDLNQARALLLAEGHEIRENPDLGPGRLMTRAAGQEALEALAVLDPVAYIFPASPALIAGVPVERCFDTLSFADDPNSGVETHFSVGQYIATVGDGWEGPGLNPVTLGYVWGTPTAKMSAGAAQGEILAAMQAWADVVDITWQQGSSLTAQDTLAIHFVSGSHGDSSPFDGPWGVLAHAFYPAPPNPEPIGGDMHFDEAESWNIGSHMDLFSVALHELGHSLGLGHSDDPSAVMYAYYSIHTELKTDDINTVKTLYAEAEADEPPPPPAPQPWSVSALPSSSSGSAENFTFTFSEATDADNLTGVAMLFNTSINPAGSCYVVYDRTVEGVYLVWDGAGGSTGKPLGSAQVLSNSQCSVGTVTASSNGGTLTVTVPVTFHATFNGTKNIYMAASASNGQLSASTGWSMRGTYQVVTGGNPVAEAVAPASGSGWSNSFTFTISDAGGSSYLKGAGILIAPSLNGSNACYLVYDWQSGTVSVVYDNVTGASPVVPGSSTTVANSQCALHGSGTSVSIGATDITITLNISFLMGYGGTHNIYLIAAENGANSGWQQVGTWTVPGDVPTLESLSPGSGSGYGTMFHLDIGAGVSTDTVMGAALLFTSGSSSNQTNACWVVYDRNTTTIGLWNDDLSELNTKILGSSMTLQNSQCAIGYAVMNVSGDTVTVSVWVQMRPAFSGTKTVYGEASTITESSGFGALGTWTVP